jgi:ammonium transporter, Amt family
LFADGTYGAGTNGVAGPVTGLLYGGGTQIVAQLIGICANFAWVGCSTFVAWKITGLITKGHRVPAEVEAMGLDTPEMGLPAYPLDDAHVPAGEPLPAPRTAALAAAAR